LSLDFIIVILTFLTQLSALVVLQYYLFTKINNYILSEKSKDGFSYIINPTTNSILQAIYPRR